MKLNKRRVKINLDQQARDDFKLSKKSVIGWIILASYCYYQRDENILSDEAFDKMCKYVLGNWTVIDHKFKYLMSEEDMKAGSLNTLKYEDYPRGFIKIAEGKIKEVNLLRTID